MKRILFSTQGYPGDEYTEKSFVDPQLHSMLKWADEVVLLPTDLPTIFISAVTGQGLTELKDLLWREINSEENRATVNITHRRLDPRHRVEEEDNFIFEQIDDEDEGYMLETDEDWEDEFWDEESSVND